MLLATESPIKQLPLTWTYQPALFPGLADPWPVLWADGKDVEKEEAISHGYRQLALSIFVQAVLDAQPDQFSPYFDSKEARQWLDKHGQQLLEMIGIDIGGTTYRRWITSGCKTYQKRIYSEKIISETRK